MGPVLIVSDHNLAHGSLVEIDSPVFVKCDPRHVNLDSLSVIAQVQIHVHNVWTHASEFFDGIICQLQGQLILVEFKLL